MNTQIETDVLKTELLQMVINDPYPDDDERRHPFHNEQWHTKPRVREIGEKLDLIGGYELMLEVANKIPASDRRSLEMAWNGIGHWQA